MLTKDKLLRLNTLAKKAKLTPLDGNELLEQKELRDEYLNNFRKHFKERLENLVFVDEDGNEINRIN